MARFYVTPRPGRNLRDPDSLEVLPVGGDWKTNKRTWVRIERAGDCKISEKPLTRTEYREAFKADPPKDPAADTKTQKD